MPRALVTVCAIAALLLAQIVCAQDLIERGRYLTVLADCEACHTDPAHPEQRFAGGRVIETPFGEVAAPNITADRDTGIGLWSDEQFDAAVRQGVRADGKRLYPAMPYPYYTRMSAADVRAIHAYLQTIPQARHAVRANRLAFPLRIRALMRIWDALYFTPGEYQSDPKQAAQWNRGAYLVQGPGHCGACHTPKNALGADQRDEALTGNITQGWFSPDLRQDSQQGLGDWTEQDISDYLKSGHNRYAAAAGPMAEEVLLSSSQMSIDDLQAIAHYLKAQQSTAEPMHPVQPDDATMLAGGAIYADLCSACHAPDAHGVPYLIPDIAASDSVASVNPATLLRVLLEGAASVATADEPTGPAMPAFGARLSDVQLAAVSTYIRNSWGHHASAVSAKQVQRARQQLTVAAAR